jgi:predicted ArsR family transcriptional regulator
VSPEQTSSAAVGAGLLASPARQGIVDALERYRPDEGEVDPGGLTSRQLADLLGLHPTTVRFHAERLEAAGIIRSHLTTVFGVGRPRKVYAVAPRASETDRTTYLLRLLELMTESFSTGATPEQAGERWARHHLPLEPTEPATSPGAWLGKVGPLVDVLQDWGYAPELTTRDGGRTCHISLTDCPFMGLARANPDVVCGIHRGLLLGALHQVGEPDVEVSLRPFVGPTLCHARVTTRQPFDSHHEESG